MVHLKAMEKISLILVNFGSDILYPPEVLHVKKFPNCFSYYGIYFFLPGFRPAL